MIQLIKAQISNIPNIQAIANEIWPITFGKLMSAQQLDYMMNMMYSTASLTIQITEKGHQFYLLKDDETYQGYISIEHQYEQKPQTKIHKIYLLSTAKGKGLGKYLMQQAEKMARDHNSTLLTLCVKRDNDALAFYENLGYKNIKEVEFDIGNGYLMQDYWLEKPLN